MLLALCNQSNYSLAVSLPRVNNTSEMCIYSPKRQPHYQSGLNYGAQGYIPHLWFDGMHWRTPKLHFW